MGVRCHEDGHSCRGSGYAPFRGDGAPAETHDGSRREAPSYKQEIVKEYFHQFFAYNNDLSIDLGTGKTTIHRSEAHTERWKVHVVDTGLSTMTGGRIKRLRHIIGNETFLCTYGDGLASVDVAYILRFHRHHGRLATLTAVRPPARFGGLEIEGDRVSTFVEKPQTSEGWINGGFFVFEPEIFDRIAAINMTAFGSRWTPCVTGVSSKNFGKAATPRGCADELFVA